MTGIYQCFCIDALNKSLLEPLINKLDNMCISYTFLDFGGGVYATIPFGILIGILNNIGALLIIRYSKDVGFHSIQSQR